MPIRIDIAHASLDINVRHARMDIKQPHAKLDITNDKAELRVQYQPAKLYVDNTAARASMNMLNVEAFGKSLADKGRQAAWDATGRTASEGSTMVRTKDPRKTMADIAFRRSGGDKFPELTPVAMPSEKPDITWTRPMLNTLFTQPRLKFDWSARNTAIISASRHEVNIKANMPRPAVRVSYTEPLNPTLTTLRAQV